MDVSWRWKLPILLIVTCPILGCDIGRFGAQCQDNSRCSNDSIYATDSIVKGSRNNEGSKHGMNALGRFPHDVRCTGYEERLTSGEMDFTNNFNTCPANETVGNLPCDDIISGGSGKTTVEPDLGFTFEVDVFGVCFNITVIEVNGEKIDYIEMFEKLNIFANPEQTKESNDSKLDKTVISESDKMKIHFPSNFVAQISENNYRLFNVTTLKPTGKCRNFGIRRKVAKNCLFKQSDISRKYTIPSEIPSNSSQNLTTMIPLVGVAILLIFDIWLIFLSVRLYARVNQQRHAVHVPPAPGG